MTGRARWAAWRAAEAVAFAGVAVAAAMLVADLVLGVGCAELHHLARERRKRWG